MQVTYYDDHPISGVTGSNKLSIQLNNIKIIKPAEEPFDNRNLQVNHF